jgi:hypothetical protein
MGSLVVALTLFGYSDGREVEQGRYKECMEGRAEECRRAERGGVFHEESRQHVAKGRCDEAQPGR